MQAVADAAAQNTAVPGALTAEAFAARLDRLGPFEPEPYVAVALSGGADSTCLAVLARDWVSRRSGRLSALIVDHGLRAESGAEARITSLRMASLGIDATVLHAAGLMRGTGLAARARQARYGLLTRACAERGIVHLLLGHHRADQAETVALRQDGGSGSAGLAGMAAIMETADLRIIRPLLDVPPGRLRATLRSLGIEWIEDPSNDDPSASRVRLRRLAADPDGTGRAIATAMELAFIRGRERAVAEREAAAWLARHAEIRPEGYALLDAGPWHRRALSALIRLIAGAEYAPPTDQVARLADCPRACTFGGVQISPAGKWRHAGWLLVREADGVRRTEMPSPDVIGDGRFRLRRGAAAIAEGMGPHRQRSAVERRAMPRLVSRTLPKPSGAGISDPGMHGSGGQARDASLQHCTAEHIIWAPPLPAACAPFAPMQPGC